MPSQWGSVQKTESTVVGLVGWLSREHICHQTYDLSSVPGTTQCKERSSSCQLLSALHMLNSCNTNFSGRPFLFTKSPCSHKPGTSGKLTSCTWRSWTWKNVLWSIFLQFMICMSFKNKGVFTIPKNWQAIHQLKEEIKQYVMVTQASVTRKGPYRWPALFAPWRNLCPRLSCWVGSLVNTLF